MKFEYWQSEPARITLVIRVRSSQHSEDDNQQQKSWSSPLLASSEATKAYGWMFGGLLLTTGISTALGLSGAFLYMVQSIPLLSILLFAVQIGLTIAMEHNLTKDTSASSMKIMFLIYAATMGINLSSVAYCYSAGQIAISLGILLAMIISQIFLMLFHVSMDVRLWSILGLAIFTGITAWDMQRMNYLLSDLSDEKMAIYIALELYLDFINIFLYVLRLIGNRNN